MKSSSNWYNVGIVGYGGFGKFLHNSWKGHNKIRISAVADKNPACRAEGDMKFYENWKDLIADPDIDIVSIVTPPATHCEIACAAMDEGKHVLIEKPIATSVKDAEKIIEKRKETGKVAAVNYMMRFNPLVEVLGVLSRHGVFGELRRVDVENYAQDTSLVKDHWFWDKETSGGILIEHAVHFIDMVHSLTDQKFKKVTGLSSSRNEFQEDRIIANVLYDRGLIATHYHSFACPGFFETNSILLGYDLARIKLAGWIPLWGKISALVNNRVKNKLKAFPNFRLSSSVNIRDVKDESRPEGWGEVRLTEGEKHMVYCGGIAYNADEMVSGTFNIGRTKGEVYSQGVRSVLEDVIRGIENPGYTPRTSLENGIASLEIAETASRYAWEVKGKQA